jgi:hypothetical protein
VTVPTQTGVLARAQWLMQNSRSIPDAVHRTFGRFSQVGTEPFLAPGQLPWTAVTVTATLAAALAELPRTTVPAGIELPATVSRQDEGVAPGPTWRGGGGWARR